MNRRSFFRALTACAMVPILGVQRTYHRMCDRGIHDNGPAFRALCRGEPVEMPDGSIQQLTGNRVYVPAGVYRFTGASPRFPFSLFSAGTGLLSRRWGR